MTKKETLKWVVQIIASIASAILTALGATSCLPSLLHSAQHRAWACKENVKMKKLSLREQARCEASKMQKKSRSISGRDSSLSFSIYR